MQNNKILNIKDVGNHKTPGISWPMDGVLIETETEIISVLIAAGQSCCESFGYLYSEDDLGLYTGADLLSVNLVDDPEKEFNDDDLKSLDCGNAYFVDIKTSKGTFSLAVYNSHNGYYGHPVNVLRKNKTTGKTQVILDDVA